jgi:hypothetical protein
MGELGALFNPGMRHELEERRSKAMRREEEGNARDGDLRIDLESGIAVINAPAANGGTAEQSPAAAEQTGDAEQDAPGEQGAADEQDTAGEQDAVSESGAADRDEAPAQDRPDQADGADPAVAPPAQPRPRGKRGLAASSR